MISSTFREVKWLLSTLIVLCCTIKGNYFVSDLYLQILILKRILTLKEAGIHSKHELLHIGISIGGS